MGRMKEIARDMEDIAVELQACFMEEDYFLSEIWWMCARETIDRVMEIYNTDGEAALLLRPYVETIERVFALLEELYHTGNSHADFLEKALLLERMCFALSSVLRALDQDRFEAANSFNMHRYSSSSSISS